VRFARLRSSLRLRLTLWYALLLGIALAVFGGLLYVALRQLLYESADNSLLRTAAAVSAALQAGDAKAPPEPGPPVGSSNEAEQGEYFWRLLDPQGDVIVQTGVRDFGDLSPLSSALPTEGTGEPQVSSVRLRDKTIRLYAASIEHGAEPAILQVGYSLDDILETLSSLRWIAAGLFVATVFLASSGGLLLANRALRPVDAMTRTARSITAQDLSQRLALVRSHDEIGRLAQTFNDMIARLEESFARQRRFTADASHELRTPLTVMKGSLNLALRKPRTPGYYRRVLRDMEEEVDRVSRLVDRLLFLARADAGRLNLEPRSIDLSGMLSALAGQLRPLAESKGLALTTEIEDDLVVIADPDAVTQVVANLLENAVRHTSEGTIILEVGLDPEEAGGVRIWVSDTGPGIPAEHLPHLFERFYRIDKARSRDQGGAGLGLSIAHELVTAHGGSIAVSNQFPGKGATFVVRLPPAPRRGQSGLG
jgi:heavy metal sensor kinase